MLFRSAVRPFTAAFTGMNRRLVEASWCLGESRWRTFWRVTLPTCWPGILAGLVLTFAHAVGEFGVVLMVGAVEPLGTGKIVIETEPRHGSFTILKESPGARRGILLRDKRFRGILIHGPHPRIQG